MRSESPHFASLREGAQVFRSDLGSITELTADSLPILRGLSAKRLLLEPGAVREPHWHANASELTYCLSGDLLVGILGDGSEFSWFRIRPGQMFYARSGALHYIENLGDYSAELIVCFSDERPRGSSFRASIAAMSDSVLGKTWGLPESAFAGLSHSTEPGWIVKRERGTGSAFNRRIRQPAEVRCRGRVAPDRLIRRIGAGRSQPGLACADRSVDVLAEDQQPRDARTALASGDRRDGLRRRRPRPHDRARS